MNIIKRFLEPAIIERKSVLNLTLYDGAFALSSASMIYATQYIVRAIENGDKANFIGRVYVLLTIAVVTVLGNIFWKPHVFLVWRNLWDRIDTISLPKVFEGDNNKYESIGTGKMIAIYSKGSTIWGDMITDVFGNLVSSLVLFLVFSITVFQKDPKMFLGICAMLLVAVFWYWLFGNKQFIRRRKAKDASIELQRTQVRWFMNKFEIIQQGKTNEELEKRYEINRRWYSAKHNEKKWQGVAFDGSIFRVTILFIALVWYSGNQVMKGVFNYSDIVVIIGLGSAFIKDLEGLMRTVRNMVDKWIDIEKMRELIDSLKTDFDISAGKKFTLKEGLIEIKNLQYTYGSDQKVFQDFTLSIQGKQKTALVGISGSGKSTLVKLIAGYLRPDGGSIQVDGQSLQEVSLTTYYKHIGYLTQEPSVFDGTVIDNLTYAINGDVDYEKLHAIISLAKCDFIRDFPDGLDTEIGERGILLSGGQRQRLAIAKVFLKDPKIIILDEPTSALDSFSEEAITQAMHNLFKGRTVIIIAHRLQTVKNADDIIVMDDGKVVERGTHTQLVSLGGSYAKMLELQSGF